MPRENGRIAFSASTGIASMNPDGSGQWGVELNVGDTAPAWSPDGSQLAVVAHLPGRVGMLVMQPDGSDARLVTTDGQDSDPAWSPDGTRIAFANGANIGVVSPDGGGRTQLTANSVGWASHPTWSPDGKTIAYALWADRIQDGVDVYRSAVSLLDVASGKESTLMPESTASDLSPAWSPDGGTIAFASYGYGSSR
ncbi:MAG TPA: hypothetical protein VNH40_08315, partial [Gaiellaceae bacterium]|nr:hypothetical protein [Gaiellaceae bacterium]